MDVKELLDNVMSIIITELGVGYEESVYREALKLELKKLGVKFECGVSVPIVYKSVVIGDSQVIGKVEIDFVIHVVSSAIEDSFAIDIM